MKINKVTITGADNTTNPEDLANLSKEYPFVEWGILFSKSKEGNLRYPTFDWVRKLIGYDMNLSAHLCGWYAKNLLETGSTTSVMMLQPLFKRFQINYNFSNSDNWNLDTALKLCADLPSLSMIFQYNKSNHNALSNLLSTPTLPENVHFLYDASGGRGSKISSIKPPFYRYTGYSGGLSPANIEQFIFDLESAAMLFPAGGPVWIDMESGVRTDDKFDLKKVEEVLKICQKYIV